MGGRTLGPRSVGPMGRILLLLRRSRSAAGRGRQRNLANADAKGSVQRETAVGKDGRQRGRLQGAMLQLWEVRPLIKVLPRRAREGIQWQMPRVWTVWAQSGKLPQRQRRRGSTANGNKNRFILACLTKVSNSGLHLPQK